MRISNDNKAVIVAAALTLSPAAANSQNTVSRQAIVQEFKQADKDENYKLNTIEYLNYVASQSINSAEMKNKVETALQKFKAADTNNDGELNIDEFTDLKENKVQYTKNEPVSSKPIGNKLQRKKEAFEIMKDINNFNKRYWRWESDEYYRDKKKAVEALKKINYSNIVEAAEKIENCGSMSHALKEEYHNNNELRLAKVDELYALMEKRAKNSGCYNRYKAEILDSKFTRDPFSGKPTKEYSSEYSNLILLYGASEIVNQAEMR